MKWCIGRKRSGCLRKPPLSGWYWLNDLLEDHGIELVLAHAK